MRLSDRELAGLQRAVENETRLLAIDDDEVIAILGAMDGPARRPRGTPGTASPDAQTDRLLVADERLVGNQRKTRTVHGSVLGKYRLADPQGMYSTKGGDRPSPAARKGRERARQREEMAQRVAELTGQKPAQGVACSVTISATPASASTFACCSAADARLALLATRAEGDRP